MISDGLFANILKVVQNDWCPAKKYLELAEKYLESGSNNDATFLANRRSRSRLQGPISVSMVSEWRCFRANFYLYLWTTFTCICEQLSLVFCEKLMLCMLARFWLNQKVCKKLVSQSEVSTQYCCKSHQSINLLSLLFLLRFRIEIIECFFNFWGK